MRYYLTLDVGGTKIKGGVLSEDGSLYKNHIHEFDALSQEPKNTILNNFIYILESMVLSIDEENFSVNGIGFAFPGPFDYVEGISLITGLNKYESIYGFNLKKWIAAMLGESEILRRYVKKVVRVVFLHDVEAFAMGESYYGEASCFRRVMYVCIGTGAGSAFTIDHRIITDPSEQVPEHGWIYNAPFKESIVDDYISARGLIGLGTEHFGKYIEGKELGTLAESGDGYALKVFSQFGENLLEALKQFLCSFKPECLVLGGQISKSHQYFEEPINRFCENNAIIMLINISTSGTIMQGIYNKLIE
jgi:glucokinase